MSYILFLKKYPNFKIQEEGYGLKTKNDLINRYLKHKYKVLNDIIFFDPKNKSNPFYRLKYYNQ